jgi:hypothetical protein
MIRSGDALLLQQWVPLELQRDCRDFDAAWVQLVVPILMVRVGRSVGHRVGTKFFDAFPRVECFDLKIGLSTPAEQAIERLHLRCDFKDLGLWSKRVAAIVQVGKYLTKVGEPMSRQEVMRIKGCGGYVADSYALCYLNDLSFVPDDLALRAYRDRILSEGN